MTPDQIEHETKYVSSKIKAKVALIYLNRICKPDPLYPKGIVNSIYFDTYRYKAVCEKENSDFIKSKFRIRWYDKVEDGEDTFSCYAEIKSKFGARRDKVRISLPAKKNELSLMKLEDSAFYKIPNYVCQKGIYLPDNLIPLFLIQYERHRFIEPMHGYRVCMDFNIRISKVNRMMIPDANPIGLNEAVFEVKGPTRTLPETLFFLSDLNFKKTSFSKFGHCYQEIRGIVK